MADFSITGEVRLNSDPAEKSTSKWTIAAGQMIADFARKASSALESVVKSGITYNAGMENYLTNFTVMKANPIGLVVSVLAALTAAFVTAYNTSETFRNIVNGAFQTVAGTAQSALSTAIGWLDQLSYKLNKALGKDAYSGYSSYEDYKSDKTTQQNRARRRQAALNGDGISTKSWTERQAEADASAKAAQQAEKTITSSANKAAAATQKAGGTVQKTVSEVVKSVTSTATTVKDGVTTTTESTTETLKNGTTQQKKVVTETSRQMVKGVLSDVKTITTTAADGSKTVTQSIEAVRDVLETTKDTHTTFADGVETTVEKVTETLADGSQQIVHCWGRTGDADAELLLRSLPYFTAGTLYFGDAYFCRFVVQKTPYTQQIHPYPVLDMMLFCPKPFWYDLTAQSFVLGGFTPSFRLPVNYSTPHRFGVRTSVGWLNAHNPGALAVPFTAILTSEANVVNPRVDNIVTGQSIRLLTTLEPGQIIEIYRTTTDKLAVKRTSAGVEENIFSLLDEDSNLVELAAGDNLLKANADTNADNLQVAVRFYPMVTGILPEVIA